MRDTSIPSTTRAQKWANFGVFLLSNAMSFGAMWGQRTVAGWLVWQMTKSPALLAATAAVELASALVITPIVGLWLDRRDQRRILVVSQGTATLLAVVLALVSDAGVLTPPVLIVLTAALGCAGAVYLPARLALLMDVAGAPGSQRAISFMALAGQIGAFSIPAVIGVVMAMRDATTAFAVLGGLHALATLTMLTVATERADHNASGRRADRVDWVTARKFLANSSAGLPQFLIVFLIAVVAGRGVTDLLAGYVDVVLKGDIALLSRLTAAIGCGALLTSIALLVVGRSDTYRQLWLSLFLALFGAAGLAITRDPLVAILAMSALGAGLSLNTTTTQTHLLDSVPPALRGRFSAVFASIWRGGPILGVAFMSTVAQWYSMECFGFAASGLLLVALLVSIRRRATVSD